MSAQIIRSPRVIAVHASAVATPGGALLFLGHAGAGKSTICRLLADRFPALADDAVYLISRTDGVWRVADGNHRAFGGPLEVAQAAALDGPTLRAVVRLYQDSASRLERIGPRQTCRHLADALFELAWPKTADASAVRAMFLAVAQVARGYPGWELHFRPDDSTAGLVFASFV
jgi:hypothetical protein